MAEDTDDRQHLEGIEDDTPDEIRTFVLANSVAAKFTVMLKQKPDGGGIAQTLRSFTNWYPDVNTLGKQWGPGSYILVFSWRAKGINGKTETVTKEYQIEMPDRAWADEHDLFLEEKARTRRDKRDAEWREEADRARAMGTHQAAPAAPSELDALKKALEVAKSLGIAIGGGGGPQKQEKVEPKKSFSDKLVDLAPAITAIGAVVGPIAIALIARVKPKEDNTLTTTLLTHVLNKPQEDGMMKQMVPFLMGTFKQMIDFKESMVPEEKQSTVEKIIDKLAPMVPAVLQMAALSAEARSKNPMVKMAQNHPDMKTLRGDPEMLSMAIQRFDEAYGFQQTNGILAVAGFERPSELADNYKAYPSNGFDANGHVVQPDAQNEGNPDVSDAELEVS